MTRLLAISVCAIVSVYGAEPSMSPRSWNDISDRAWSGPALRLQAAQAGVWQYAETPRYVLAAETPRALRWAGEEADAAFHYFAGHLGVPAPARRAVILTVRDRSAWTNLAPAAQLRSDSGAFQTGRELFIHYPPNPPDGRVAHEVAHFVIRESLSAHLPLWLEEGLALHWGWQLLLQPGRAAPPFRRVAGIERKRLQTLQAWMACREYPGDPVAFYRQCEEGVAALEARLGDKGLVEFARVVGVQGGDPAVVLAAQGWKEADFEAWHQDVIRRSMETKTEP